MNTGKLNTHPMIEIRDVSKKRNGRTVLNSVSLEVREGEFFSVLGPSGCGKTTLLRLISGLEQPDSGEVLVDGQPVSQWSPRSQKVLLVFQNFALFPHLTVAQNVGFGLRLKGLDVDVIRKRVDYYLDMVKLSGFRDRYPSQLSGGQQQRVAIARALAPEPSAILFDEPLGALDQKLRREMQFELKALQERLGMTFIYVTHDQEEALTLSDRIALMNFGEIVQEGDPFDLYHRPANHFAAQFIGDNNSLSGSIIKAVREGTYRLSIGDSYLDIPYEKPLSLDSAVQLFVRPEHIGLAAPGENSPSDDEFCVLECETRQQLFVGREALVHIEAAGQKLVAKVSPGQSYSSQRKMHCFWRKSDVHLFPVASKG